jgi:hypothetical protein
MDAPDGEEVNEVGAGEGEEGNGKGEVAAAAEAARPGQVRRRGGGGGRGRAGAPRAGQHLAASHGRRWFPSTRPSVASVGLAVAVAGAVASSVLGVCVWPGAAVQCSAGLCF